MQPNTLKKFICIYAVEVYICSMFITLVRVTQHDTNPHVCLHINDAIYVPTHIYFYLHVHFQYRHILHHM